MSVRVSPISRGAALLIIVVGLVTLVLAGDIVGDVAGVVFLVLGIVLYWLLYRFAGRVEREIGGARASSRGPG